MPMISEAILKIKAMLDFDASSARAGLKEFERDASATAKKINDNLGATPNPTSPRSGIINEELASQGARGPTSASVPISTQADTSPLASHRAQQKLIEFLGPTKNYTKNRKAVNAMIKEEWQTVRDLEEQYRRLKSTQKDQSHTQQADLQKQIKGHRELAMAMRTAQASGEVHEHMRHQKEGWLQRMRGGAGAGFAQGMSFKSAMRGGGITQLGGGITRGLMAHPLIGPVIAGVGAAGFGYILSEKFSQYSEDLDRQMLSTSRRIGQPPGSQGGTIGKLYESQRGKYEKLGYSKENAFRAMEAFSLPGMTADDSLAHAKFGRQFGFDPSMIAGIGRQARQMGEAGVGQQTRFFEGMANAIKQGYVNGVDGSETMKTLLGLTAKISQYTGVVSRNYTAGVSGLLDALGSSKSRFFTGERGGEALSGILSGLANPQSLQAKVMLNYELRKQFDGNMPGANQIGLSGAAAKSYTAMNDVAKGNYILQTLPELNANEDLSKKVRDIMGNIFLSISKNAAPGTLVEMMKSMFPSSLGTESKVIAATSSLAEKGYTGNVAEQIGHAIIDGGAKALEFLHADKLKADATDVERVLGVSKDATELASQQVSKETLNMRLGSKEILRDFTKNIIDVINDPFGSSVKGFNSLHESLFGKKSVDKKLGDNYGNPAMNMIDPVGMLDRLNGTVKYWHDAGRELAGKQAKPEVDELAGKQSQKVLKPSAMDRDLAFPPWEEDRDRALRKHGLSPDIYKQSYSRDTQPMPATISVNVSGTIDLTGSTTGTIDGQAMRNIIVSQIEDWLQQGDRMRGSRYVGINEALV